MALKKAIAPIKIQIIADHISTNLTTRECDTSERLDPGFLSREECQSPSGKSLQSTIARLDEFQFWQMSWVLRDSGLGM
jgi:hypothetical protein